MAYADLLKDPRWQKRRLEILNRDNFTCQYCGADYMTLHVHHKAYSKEFMEPWNYSDRALTTLCENCHKDAHNGMDEALDLLKEAIKIAGMLPKDIKEIAEGFINMDLQHAPEVMATSIKDTLLDYDLQEKMLINFFFKLSERSEKLIQRIRGEEVY